VGTEGDAPGIDLESSYGIHALIGVQMPYPSLSQFFLFDVAYLNKFNKNNHISFFYFSVQYMLAIQVMPYWAD